MSKLYNTYLTLKKHNSQTIYLFKSGIFFIALDADAHILSNIFHFKLGNLTDSIVKCGFPCSSFDKYSNLFKSYQLNIKIIEMDNNTSYNLYEYKQSQATTELLNAISSIDIDNLSISETYKLLEEIQNKAKKITNIGVNK